MSYPLHYQSDNLLEGWGKGGQVEEINIKNVVSLEYTERLQILKIENKNTK